MGYIVGNPKNQECVYLASIVESGRELTEHIGVLIGEPGCAPVFDWGAARATTSAPLYYEHLVLASERLGTTQFAVALLIDGDSCGAVEVSLCDRESELGR